MESKSLPPHLSTLRRGFMRSGDPRSHLIMAQNGKEMLSSPSPGVSMETVPALPLLPSASREEWGSCLNEAGGSAGGSGDCYSVEPPYLFEATNQRESRDPPPPPVCELRDVPAALGIFPITLGVQLSHQGIKNV